MCISWQPCWGWATQVLPGKGPLTLVRCILTCPWGVLAVTLRRLVMAEFNFLRPAEVGCCSLSQRNPRVALSLLPFVDGFPNVFQQPIDCWHVLLRVHNQVSLPESNCCFATFLLDRFVMGHLCLSVPSELASVRCELTSAWIIFLVSSAVRAGSILGSPSVSDRECPRLCCVISLKKKQFYSWSWVHQQ